MSEKHIGETKPSLSRGLTPVGAWALSFGCIVGWGAFVMPATTFLPAAGPLGVVVAFIVGTAMILVIASNYGFMMQRCTDAGGVYAFAREAFGPNHAFICSWSLVLVYTAAISANATATALIARSVIGDALQVGIHYSIAGYDVYLGEIAVALATIAVVAFISLRGIRIVGIIQTALAAGMVIGTTVIAWLVS